MAFSTRQIQALKRNPDPQSIRKREAHGRELSYIEGWYAIAEANRIFGFDSWNRETLDSRCVIARENRGTFLAVYVARVRVTVNARGTSVIREGHGTGEGRGDSPGEVHDIALKVAETDATKRALATFGRPFGLELYRHSGKSSPKTVTSQRTPLPARTGLHPDDTTPIPRPSRYFGRSDQPSLIQQIGHEVATSASPPLAPNSASQVRIDKSVLTLGEPKRLRDKAHLKFVSTRPCLICERQPSDPHHLRFAQPRAIGLKVSDEFTVPLCRGHHRQLHQSSNELRWWESMYIEPLPIARKLWEQTHPETRSKQDGELQQPDKIRDADFAQSKGA